MCFSSIFSFFFEFSFQNVFRVLHLFFRGRLLCGVFYPHVTHLLGVQKPICTRKDGIRVRHLRLRVASNGTNPRDEIDPREMRDARVRVLARV